LLGTALASTARGQALQDAPGHFEKDIRPILEAHCYDCHGDGEKKGQVAFDTLPAPELTNKSDLWMAVLKNVRAGLMPPSKEPRLPAAEMAKLEDWIKRGAFKLDPANPDPGRVTLRRLNRVEYRNTIRDLMGVDFRADSEFPADDTGYGFDNIGDVLSTSPLLLEKYMAAAETIVGQVPLVSRSVAERDVAAKDLVGVKGKLGENHKELGIVAQLSFYEPANVSTQVKIEKAGTYRLALPAAIVGTFDYDPGRASATAFVDGREVWKREVQWRDREVLDISTERYWEPGEYTVRFVLQPLVEKKAGSTTFAKLEWSGVKLTGPLERDQWTATPGYSRFFPRVDPPKDRAEWPAYASEVLERFATRAFRRPADPETVSKLTRIAQLAWKTPGNTFEKGVSRAMVAVLASPRFLFRVEDVEANATAGQHPFIDEYALASRLSYFLWSTMPDEELIAMASRGELRQNLASQVKRMLADPKSEELVRNFAGQWLQTRDIDGVSIDPRVVLARDAGTERDDQKRGEELKKINAELEAATQAGDTEKAAALKKQLTEMREKARGKRFDFSADLRASMRREVEMLFSHLLREGGTVRDLIDPDYTYLNEALAQHYGIPDVKGREMRLVKLPADSPRGGVLTMGSTLAVTSNPDRTSPVKRGIFVLDNVLGTPPPPAPPDVPSLEASVKNADGHEQTLREALAQHRAKAICASCHNRMDPLGLAFENFNALGLWRDQERGQPIPSVAGQLITGEKFANVKELKHLLVNQRRDDFYRCLTEKLLTYALGRGPQSCDVTTVDAIVDRLRNEDGRLTTLVSAIIESTPFQKRRADVLISANP
jgi:cytochrome c553